VTEMIETGRLSNGRRRKQIDGSGWGTLTVLRNRGEKTLLNRLKEVSKQTVSYLELDTRVPWSKKSHLEKALGGNSSEGVVLGKKGQDMDWRRSAGTRPEKEKKKKTRARTKEDVVTRTFLVLPRRS